MCEECEKLTVKIERLRSLAPQADGEDLEAVLQLITTLESRKRELHPEQE